MAYENVEFIYNNFCIGPVAGTFCSIDTSNNIAALQFKNSSGDLLESFYLNPTITQGVAIDSLVYTGPTGLLDNSSGVLFYTLENITNTSCIIKRWELNVNDTRMDFVASETYNTTPQVSFNSYEMAIDHNTTTFSNTTISGINKISVESTYNIEVGTILTLGPSSYVENLGVVERISVIFILDNDLYIKSDNTPPTIYQYNMGDLITFSKHIYLFSDATSNDNKGALHIINANSLNYISSIRGGLYDKIRASSYGIPYGECLAFIKNTNLVYISLDNFRVLKSNKLLIEDFEGDLITAHSLAFDSNTIYRLQHRDVRRTDLGDLAVYDWASYNYRADSVAPYVDNISMYTPSSILSNAEEVTINALVRDQYGNTLNNILVTFDKSGDLPGYFLDPNKQVYTNTSGIASLVYKCGWYNYLINDMEKIDLSFQCYTLGSSILTGSEYVYGKLNSVIYPKKIDDNYSFVTVNDFSSSGNLSTKSNFISEKYTKTICKFNSVGGNFMDGVGYINPPNTPNVKILRSFVGESPVTTLGSFFNSGYISSVLDVEDTCNISQLFISRHLTEGHTDTAIINQFRFLLEADPEPWSVKNRVNTNVWLKVAPFGFDLNISTVSFKVRCVSYAGDTGYVEYAGTPNLILSTFDAGSGLLGLYITYTSSVFFEYGSTVYIRMSVYDNATVPNIIYLDYWFKIVDDYKTPFIINEFPPRNSYDVLVDSPIYFTILDIGAGVAINTLKVYVNTLEASFTYQNIPGGYLVECNNLSNFYYSQIVELLVTVEDISDNKNLLFESWQFSCITSKPPLFDVNTLIPRHCAEGLDRFTSPISINVYDQGHGILEDSIILEVNGIKVSFTKEPVIRRVSD